MIVNKLIEQKKISRYQLSKNSGIPYTTICDICNGKAKLSKCSAETVYKLSKEFDVSMETLLEPYLTRCDFELFKSNVCHKVKELGDVGFIIETLESNDIRNYYEKEWYPESLYLLAMLDYISRMNDVPLCSDYDDLRCVRLSEIIYPASILAVAAATKNDKIKEQAKLEAIPEFLKYNIVESEVRNVI